jgi:hypothetical protein
MAGGQPHRARRAPTAKARRLESTAEWHIDTSSEPMLRSQREREGCRRRCRRTR